MTVEPGFRRGVGLLVPEVSVVMIFKDAEEFLGEAIESVREQTLDGWELLLVDDGSRDLSTAIARWYSAEEPWRIRYFEHPDHENRGMSATRNLGVSRAHGEFIAFLDSDDALTPSALADQLAILRADASLGMVYGPVKYWYGWTGKPEDEMRDHVHPVGVAAEQVHEPPSLISTFVRDKSLAPSGMLLRRSVVRQTGGFVDSFRDVYEDQVFAAKVCRSTRVYVSGRCWYRYRQHPNSCCIAAQREGRLDAARGPFLQWLAGYLDAEGLGESDAARTVGDELLELERVRSGGRGKHTLLRIGSTGRRGSRFGSVRFRGRLRRGDL